jgi:hypothetical protein
MEGVFAERMLLNQFAASQDPNDLSPAPSRGTGELNSARAQHIKAERDMPLIENSLLRLEPQRMFRPPKLSELLARNIAHNRPASVCAGLAVVDQWIGRSIHIEEPDAPRIGKRVRSPASPHRSKCDACSIHSCQFWHDISQVFEKMAGGNDPAPSRTAAIVDFRSA